MRPVDARSWSVPGRRGRRVVVREPEHRPDGDPCARCGLAAGAHRDRREREKDRSEARRLAKIAEPIVGIDGEGHDLPCTRCGRVDRGLARCPAGDGPCARRHVYTYLSAVDETGRKLGSIFDPIGLGSERILRWLIDLGESRLFGYSLGYDLTMWLRDLPDRAIYRLLRPETRHRVVEGKTIRSRVRWRGYAIDHLRRRTDVQRSVWDEDARRYVSASARVTIWDVFAFYQGSFVRSLQDWKIGGDAVVRQISEMKAERGRFAELSDEEVQKYCDNECMLLAQLVRRLIAAHEDAGLPLKNFYGAGSTGAALLDRMGTRSYRGEIPPEMKSPVRRAFVGGRFENSVVGPIHEFVWGYDLSSAYPYVATRLPCLSCGTWRRVIGPSADAAAREARMAVVRCRVKRSGPSSWGPLPWRREKDGGIVWPLALEDTWVWQDEYLAARDTIWPGVEAVEAWRYDSDCDHRPFGELPEVYRERCRIGKDGAGIVLKLGPNAVAGKCAQSSGSAPYQSWPWAGAITSGCRAKILCAIAAAKDPASILMVATDGIQSIERLTLPPPADTGTSDVVSGGRLKPLGGWEETEIPEGVFMARPGIYWPIGGLAKRVKARGISRSVLGGYTCPNPDHRSTTHVGPGSCGTCGAETVVQSTLIERHFDQHGWQVDYRIDGCVRFVGAKTGVRNSGARGIVRDEEYGCWIHHPMTMRFKAQEKRAGVRSDNTLEPWARMAGSSAEYDPHRRSSEAKLLQEHEAILEEQPDGEVVV